MKLRHLYEKSSKQGYNNAQWKLRFFYEKGKGTEKNLEKAIYWYEKSGHMNAQYNLGSLYENGI